MASPVLGRVLSERFRIVSFLGEGAMANVYRGQDLKPVGATEVAIKIMHPALMADPTFVQRFRREAKAAMRLRHPNTVQVIEYGVDKELVYIAMELLDGQDLFEVLVAEQRLTEAKAAKIMIQICDALVVAHAEGIVHRDLKPENIMLLRGAAKSEEVNVKVLDFGIAKILDRDEPLPDSEPNSLGSAQLTTVGVVVGTPAYMSPEQCRGDAIDARSDLYSCGVLLYQLVTGRVPFAGTTPVQIAMLQLREAPPAPTRIVPGLHPGLEATILTALAKWPAQRQQSAAELKKELEQVLTDLPDFRHPPSGRNLGGPPVSTREAIASQRHPIVLADVKNLSAFEDEVAAARVATRPSAIAAPPARSIEAANAGAKANAPTLAPPPFQVPIAAAPIVIPVVSAAAIGSLPTASPSIIRTARAPDAPVVIAAPELSPVASPAIAIAARTPPNTKIPPWLLVPLAICVGIAMGAIAFLLAR